MKNIYSLSKAVLALSFGMFMLPISKTYAVDASTTYSQTSIPGVTYYFTIAVPTFAAKPLQQVTLTQIEGGEHIEFDAKQSKAFVGTSDRAAENLPVSLVKNPSQDDSVIVQFAQPLPPGKTVTIALKAYSNPTWDGVYLFNLNIAPANQNTEALPLGIARLQFYPPDF
ncbi:MAG: DUF2808 domain-containing protein [Aulosira sp. ZfuVER01]|nr:DUF2808 domain-containing protein [Aulosira sp. ZfuVER01]MDZ7997973.1 DUF2808 domain-containing protein [Aulosira sp. DedVER01a]MDZ8054636.1 DUF2808 domain-containing protein [Aulosira sp. ZfuCHP01]